MNKVSDDQRKDKEAKRLYWTYLIIAIVVGVVLSPFSFGISFLIPIIVVFVLRTRLEWKTMPEEKQREFRKRVSPGLQKAGLRSNWGCPSCGAKLDRDARFCSECGYEIVKSCKSCGTAFKEGQKFCAKCGSKLA